MFCNFELKFYSDGSVLLNSNNFELRLQDTIFFYELKIQEIQNENNLEIFRLKQEIGKRDSQIKLLESKIQLLESQK